jgi:Tfp pilus assembly protein PilX
MVMVIIITLVVISAIRIANVNLKITGNFQWQKVMELIADSALEQVLSSLSSFDNTAVQTGTATASDICADGAVVTLGSCSLLNPKIGTVSVPVCTATRVASGYSKALGTLSPVDNDWVITSAVADNESGANVKIHRGITVRMMAGTCPE